MKKLFKLSFVCLFLAGTLAQAQDVSYQTPPKDIADLLLALTFFKVETARLFIHAFSRCNEKCFESRVSPFFLFKSISIYKNLSNTEGAVYLAKLFLVSIWLIGAAKISKQSAQTTAT